MIRRGGRRRRRRRSKARPIHEETEENGEDEEDEEDEEDPRRGREFTDDELEDAIVEFNDTGETLYAFQIDNSRGIANRRQALESRVPRSLDPTTAREQKKTREYVLRGLELIDIVEQTMIMEHIIDVLGTLEKAIHTRMIESVKRGCNIETLTGNAMIQLEGPADWNPGPKSPINASAIFETNCAKLDELHATLKKVMKLSDKAEKEGGEWRKRLKAFAKPIVFHGTGTPGIFHGIGPTIDQLQGEALERGAKARRPGVRKKRTRGR